MTSRTALRHYTAAVILAFSVPPNWAQSAPHTTVEADKLTGAALPSLSKGEQIAVVAGSMDEAVPFTMRLKFPANSRTPPHWHPAVKRVIVLSGTFNMGGGDSFNSAKTHAVNVGSMAIMPAKSNQFAWTPGETAVQLHGTGPLGITHGNSADDPRTKQLS